MTTLTVVLNYFSRNVNVKNTCKPIGAVEGDKSALQMASRVLGGESWEAALRGNWCGYSKHASIGFEKISDLNHAGFLVGRHTHIFHSTQRGEQAGHGNLIHQIYVLKHCGHKICFVIKWTNNCFWWILYVRKQKFSCQSRGLALLNSMLTFMELCAYSFQCRCPINYSWW